MADLAQTEYARVLDRLSDLSFQSPDTLVPVANALKLKIEQTEPFSRFGGDSELSKNKAIIDAAFSHDTLVLGNNSEPIPLDNDSVVVLRVHKHVPSAEKSLPEVKSLITETLALKKAELLASSLGNQFLALNKQPKQREILMQKHQLKWHQVHNATRDADEASPAINELAFGLSKTMNESGQKLSGSFVVVQLESIHAGDIKSLDKEQLASIQQQLEANYGVMDYDLYLRGLLKKANVVKI